MLSFISLQPHQLSEQELVHLTGEIEPILLFFCMSHQMLHFHWPELCHCFSESPANTLFLRTELLNAVASPNNAKAPNAEQLACLLKVLRWPVNVLFPGKFSVLCVSCLER